MSDNSANDLEDESQHQAMVRAEVDEIEVFVPETQEVLGDSNDATHNEEADSVDRSGDLTRRRSVTPPSRQSSNRTSLEEYQQTDDSTLPGQEKIGDGEENREHQSGSRTSHTKPRRQVFPEAVEAFKRRHHQYFSLTASSTNTTDCVSEELYEQPLHSCPHSHSSRHLSQSPHPPLHLADGRESASTSSTEYQEWPVKATLKPVKLGSEMVCSVEFNLQGGHLLFFDSSSHSGHTTLDKASPDTSPSPNAIVSNCATALNRPMPNMPTSKAVSVSKPIPRRGRGLQTTVRPSNDGAVRYG